MGKPFERAWCAPAVVGTLIVFVSKNYGMDTPRDIRFQKPMWSGVQCYNAVKTPIYGTITGMAGVVSRFASAGTRLRIFWRTWESARRARA
jgi:hypothetical protein